MINRYRDPKWWTEEDDAAWACTKAFLKCEWLQLKKISGSKEPLTGPTEAAIEAAHRFAYGAYSHFGRKFPEWSGELENRLRCGWSELYPERAEHWEVDFEALRYGWEYEGNLSDSTAVVPKKTGPLGPPPESKHRYRILVVEDDPDIRSLNADVLIYYGYTVDTAEDGMRAFAAINRGRYDLMVTDNCMPNMTGVELLGKLHNNELSLPTVMATSFIPSREFQKHPWLTPAVTLLKPYNLSDLLEKVSDVLRQNHRPSPPPSHS